MLGLTYADDMNVVHFQKLIAFVKINQRKEQLSDRYLQKSKNTPSEAAVDIKNQPQ
jgi:hypothetical protein